jgi:penicillin-binding protein 1C
MAADSGTVETRGRDGCPEGAQRRCPNRRKGVLSANGAKLPPPLRRFSPALVELARRRGSCFHQRGSAGARGRRRAAGGENRRRAGSPLTVLVNGVPVETAGGRRTVFFRPDGPGFVRLTVMDGRGAADSVTVRLQSLAVTGLPFRPICRRRGTDNRKP